MKLEEQMEVKKGLEKEYEAYVNKNQDGYGNAVIIAGAEVGRLLTEGKSCNVAEKSMNEFDLTGFMAGCLAQSLAHFHPRGDEFRVFWNKSFGVTDSKGVVNPAIMECKV